MKEVRLLCLLDLFEGGGEKGQCDLVCMCGAIMDDWVNGDYVDVLFTFAQYSPIYVSY